LKADRPKHHHNDTPRHFHGFDQQGNRGALLNVEDILVATAGDPDIVAPAAELIRLAKARED
jgi:hypothetical protein